MRNSVRCSDKISKININVHFYITNEIFVMQKHQVLWASSRKPPVCGVQKFLKLNHEEEGQRMKHRE